MTKLNLGSNFCLEDMGREGKKEMWWEQRNNKMVKSILGVQGKDGA